MRILTFYGSWSKTRLAHFDGRRLRIFYITYCRDVRLFMPKNTVVDTKHSVLRSVDSIYQVIHRQNFMHDLTYLFIKFSFNIILTKDDKLLGKLFSLLFNKVENFKIETLDAYQHRDALVMESN